MPNLCTTRNDDKLKLWTINKSSAALCRREKRYYTYSLAFDVRYWHKQIFHFIRYNAIKYSVIAKKEETFLYSINVEQTSFGQPSYKNQFAILANLRFQFSWKPHNGAILLLLLSTRLWHLLADVSKTKRQ